MWCDLDFLSRLSAIAGVGRNQHMLKPRHYVSSLDLGIAFFGTEPVKWRQIMPHSMKFHDSVRIAGIMLF